MADKPTPIGGTLRQRIWAQLGSRRVWSLGLAIQALIFYTVLAVAFDAFRLNSFDPAWIVVWVGTYLEAVAAVLLLLLILPSRLWKTTARGRWTNFAIAAVVGAIKNSTVFWWATTLGLESSAFSPVGRLFGGAMLSTMILLTWVSLNGSRMAHRALMSELTLKQTRLLNYRSQVPAQVSKAQSDLIEQSKSTLLPKLAELDSYLGESRDASSALKQLQDLVENQVRPLSHALQVEAAKLANTAEPKKLTSPRRGQWPDRFRLRENLLPMSILIFVLPGMGFTISTLLDQQYIPIALGSLAVAAFALYVWKLLLPKRKLVSKRRGVFALLTGAALSSASITGYMALVVPKEANGMVLVSVASAIELFVSAYIVAYINILDDSRIELENQMALINDKINHEVSVFDQMLWLQKRRWGYLLHGSVQATITAAMARLKSLELIASDRERQTEAGMITELVRQDLRKVAETITNPPAPQVDLNAELKALQDTWRGVVEISLQVTERAQRVLVKSDNTRMALNEICREAVTNAYRHGEASTMTIRIDRPADEEIALTITNNGRHPGDVRKGMGLQMMDALTLDWSFEAKKTAALTVLSARLPVALS